MNTLLLAAVVASGGIQQVDIQSLELTRPEGPRHYLLADPATKVDHRLPLVILLHGHTGSAKQLLGQGIGAAPLSLWLEIGVREDVVVIAPDGARGSDKQQGWNDCRVDAESNPPTDDVGFISALIDQAVADYNVDPKHVYVMGMSNGAMMALRLAIEMPEKLAAVAAVGGSLAAKSECKAPSKKMSVLMISGDADPFVPWPGGDVRRSANQSRGSVISIEDSARSWRVLDGLAEKASEARDIPKLDVADKTHAHLWIWGSDPKRYQVELIRIDGGGHIEPSIRQRIGVLYGELVGAQNGDFEASEEAWRFFHDK